ncbi:MAG TPA: diguanylate cyclase [Gemmatimonadales bacterium]|nr:diguanylate cyclase [Gemmatimonadales bacterium]
MKPVPARALWLSLAALAVPVTATFAFPDSAQEDQGPLIWLTALVPAFLFAYYRGIRGVALALAAGMALLALSTVAIQLLGLAAPNWAFLLALVAVYVGVCVGIAAFAEVLHRERAAAQALALSDPLTGLPNRRHAELILDQQFASAVRGRPFAVVLFDVDRFKQVNDRFGHDTGDVVLRGFGDILHRTTRRMDLSARFGGEEFIAVLVDTQLEHAVAFAERVRKALPQASFPCGPVTVSAGVAAYQDGMGSWEVLVAAADRALYAAKNGGRDRVEAAESFPTHRTTPLPRRFETPATGDPGGHGQSILVVDDDPQVLDALVRTLERADYRVEGVTDPRTVVARYQQGQVPDLLITDVMMPGLSGLALVGLLMAMKPDLKVVYMSGYLQRPVSWTGLPGGTIGFLEKPIERDVLLRTIRDVLDRAPVVAA